MSSNLLYSGSIVTPLPSFDSIDLTILSNVNSTDIKDVSGFQAKTGLKYITLPANEDVLVRKGTFLNADDLLEVRLTLPLDMSSNIATPETFPIFSGTRPYFYLSGNASDLHDSTNFLNYLNRDASNCLVFYDTATGSGWPSTQLNNTQISVPPTTQDGNNTTPSFEDIFRKADVNGISVTPNGISENNSKSNFIFTNPATGLQFVQNQNQN